jgi:hypothetical protein
VARTKPEAKIPGRLVSIFGPFNSRALIEISVEGAERLVDGGELQPCGTGVIDAVDRELVEMRGRAPALADSAIAAAARALAFEIENPYNSATSKSMCARELREDMDRLRELSPPQLKKDALDEVNQQRERRQRAAWGAAAADQVRS